MRGHCICVLIIILLSKQSTSFSLPDHWVSYFQWLEGFTKEHVLVGFPQVLHPSEMLLSQNAQGMLLMPFLPLLPRVIIWNPLVQFPSLFGQGLSCFTCGRLLVAGRWNTGCRTSTQPRVLHDLESIVMLIANNYRCSNGHNTLSYDPRILSLIPSDTVPFLLSHKSGYTNQLMKIVLGLTEQGNDFSKIVIFIRRSRMNQLSELKKHGQRLLSSTCTSQSLEQLTAVEMLSCVPSRYMLTSVFLQNFFLNKEEQYTQHMRSLSCNGYISLDHTFSVAANIGYFRSDHKWVTQYSSLFIVLNEIGQVLTWKFTKGESYDEVQTLLDGLHQRLIFLRAPVKVIIIDNCCHWKYLLKRTFGDNVKIKLDLFHAVQRVTRTISKRHSLYKAFLREFRMVFRAAGDVADKRTQATPEPNVLTKNIDDFTERWQKISPKLMSSKTLKEISNLKKHIDEGCLSAIPPGHGTNRNEALHTSTHIFIELD